MKTSPVLRSHFAFCILCAALGLALVMGLLLLTPSPVFAQSPSASKGSVSFIKDVAPILKENCFACHNAKQRKGKFDMSTFESLRKGGSGDDPIVSGKPDESPLLDRLTATDKSRMPPKEAGQALPKEKIAVIEKWIAEGAKLDAGLSPSADILRELRVRWKPPVPPASYPFAVTITALAFTPDSQKLVIGGHHELTVWDVAQAKLEKRIYTRMERAYAMVFLPGGELAVAGGRPGQEGDVRIYNLQGGTPKLENGVAILDGVNDPGVMVKQLLETDDSVLCLALSSDGKKLASGGSQDRLVHVWNLMPGYANAQLEQTIENHADWVFGVAFSPDGKLLLTCSRDKTAKVWDLAAKESLLTFPDHQNPVYGVAMKSEGKVAISVGEDNQVRFWNATAEGKQIRAVGGHTKAIFRVLSHPKQPILATCSADGTVRLWNADNGKLLHTLTGHSDWVYALALSPDG
ncbi:MAG TPA: c-type cytochrome domain-containing protein, partial [Gemmataceae bacterium]|nr:c-type cytochrome domain-containing protein [Gemmataceae bacterium]